MKIHLMDSPALAGLLRYIDKAIKTPPEPLEKKCLHCGKVFRHNNAFCSAEHLLLYKKERR